MHEIVLFAGEHLAKCIRRVCAHTLLSISDISSGRLSIQYPVVLAAFTSPARPPARRAIPAFHPAEINARNAETPSLDLNFDGRCYPHATSFRQWLLPYKETFLNNSLQLIMELKLPF